MLEIKKDIVLPKYISGPVSFSHYKIKGKDLLLFGDIHESIENMCQPCNLLDPTTNIPTIQKKSKDCYTLSAWIQSILEKIEGTNEIVDLYVEDPLSYIKDKFLDVSDSYEDDDDFRFDGRLGELFRVFGHKSSNLRYHYIDNRFFKTDENEDANLIYDNIGFVLNNLFPILLDYPKVNIREMVDELENFLIDIQNILRDYIFLCATSIDYSSDVENFVKQLEMEGESFIYFELSYMKIVHHFLETRHLTKKYKGMILHPIGKQFRKLLVQEKYKGNATERIKLMAGFIIDQNRWIWADDMMILEFRNIISNIRNKKSGVDRSIEVMKFWSPLFNYFSNPFILDAYAIPRILYSYPHSKIKIYVSGDYHIEIFQKFLNEFYSDSFVQSKSFNERTEWVLNRCLDMSKLSKKPIYHYTVNQVTVKKFTE